MIHVISGSVAGKVAGVLAGAVLALSASGPQATAGVQFAAWNFNGAQGTLEPSTGQGSAATVGGTSGTFSAGDPTDDGSAKPAENKAWNIASFAAQGSGSGERGVRFDVSTAGQGALAVSWRERHSNSASRFVQFQYSLDGVDFSSDGLAGDGIFFAGLGGDTWYNGRSVSLAGIAGASNNANFAFRIVAIFAPGTSGYVASTATATYASTGTARFDMVTVSGTIVPAPGVMAAFGVMGLAAARRRRA